MQLLQMQAQSEENTVVVAFLYKTTDRLSRKEKLESKLDIMSTMIRWKQLAQLV